MSRNVKELTRAELDELKQSYVTALLHNPSYDGLTGNQNIPDEVLFEWYKGVHFNEDDFFAIKSDTIGEESGRLVAFAANL